MYFFFIFVKTKTNMKKLEIILGFFAVLGIALKYFHIPGSTIIIILSFSILSAFYYLFSFAHLNGIGFRGIFKKDSYRQTTIKRILLAVALGFSLSILIIGMLFKIQFWPGALMTLSAGLILCSIVFLFTLFFFLRNKIMAYKRFFIRIYIYGILGLILFLIPQTSLIDVYYRKNPDYAEIYKKHIENPDDEEIKEEMLQKREEMYQQKEEE